MTRDEAVEQLQNCKQLIFQDGKDWLDERDIPLIDMAIVALSARRDTVTLNSPITILSDVVAVVRCKDCEASRVYGKTTKWLACEDVMEGQATDPDGYCYLGKRREKSEVEE